MAKITGHRNDTAGSALGGHIGKADSVSYPTFGIRHHPPLETGDLLGPETGSKREQEDDLVSHWVSGSVEMVEDSPNLGRTKNLGLSLEHGWNPIKLLVQHYKS